MSALLSYVVGSKMNLIPRKNNEFKLIKMMKNIIRLFAVVATTLLFSCSSGNDPVDPPVDPDPPTPTPVEPGDDAHDYLIGSLFGFEGNARRGNLKDDANSTLYNLPLFYASDENEEWWDNLVEEFAYSGMDYAMANCRGVLPDKNKYTDHGDPYLLKYLVEAMERRGVADKFKIAIFDDCPASWAAARNLDLHGKYVPTIDGVYDYPIGQLDGDGGIYKYIWDYNVKLAFQTVPDKYLLKFQDRPVLFFWSVNNFLDPGGRDNYSGKLSAILKRLREDFKKEFGVNPFIVVDRAFYDRDHTVYYPVTDAINDWFNMTNSYTVRTHNSVTIGVGVPGFSINDKKGNHMFIDANHGQTLERTITSTIDAKSDIILIEGFTDAYENASLWRSTDTKFYDYPNQRLNIVRRYTKDPYPKELKVEAEGCDFYKDNTKGNSGGAFRKGDLDVAKCDDVLKGWCVIDAVGGEWLQWKELPLRSGSSTFSLRYSSSASAKVRFKVGDKDLKEIELPSTNNEWKSIDAGSIELDERGLHDVTFNIVSGDIDVNYFVIVASK